MQGGYVKENPSALMEPVAIQPVTQMASVVQELSHNRLERTLGFNDYNQQV